MIVRVARWATCKGILDRGCRCTIFYFGCQFGDGLYITEEVGEVSVYIDIGRAIYQLNDMTLQAF
jgi:hypothetical protein